ncbi:unnamed protein product [Boreogadus saida]
MQGSVFQKQRRERMSALRRRSKALTERRSRRIATMKTYRRRETPADGTGSVGVKQHGDGNRDERETVMDFMIIEGISETESVSRPQKERKAEETTKKRKAALQAEEKRRKRRKREERRTK